MTTANGLGIAETGFRMIDWGLEVVPVWVRSKIPYSHRDWNIAIGSDYSDADRTRITATTPEQWRRIVEDLKPGNLAVLGVVQVDADDTQSLDLLRELAVSLDGRHWLIKTPRGWRWIYRQPERRKLSNVIKNGNVCQNPKCELEPKPHTRDPHGEDCVELDLLINTQALVPPSIHPTNVQYRWVAGHSPEQFSFRDLDQPPELLLDYWENRIRANHGPRRGDYASQRRQLAGFEAALAGALAVRTRSGQLNSPNARGVIDGISCIFESAHKNGDRTPSFIVNFREQWFKCYGCGAHGNLKVLADALNVPYVEVRHHRGGAISVKGEV